MNTRLQRTTKLVGALAGVAIVATGILVGCRSGFVDLFTGGGDFLVTGKTNSFFTAIQIDPPSEDSAGPQFAVAEDVNGDGLLDIISAWNQSQPVQVHLQRRSASGAISFETLTLAGNISVVSVAGLAVADFDLDGRMDIAVLVKESLFADPGCLNNEATSEDIGLSGAILLYLGPADMTTANQALAWQEVQVGVSLLEGTGDGSGTPEVGGFTSMAIGDMDNDGDMDIVAAWNSSCGGGVADVVIFTNLGAAAIQDASWFAETIPDELPKGTAIKDIALGDIDLDGDLDVVATFPDAMTMNIRWFRNPTTDVPDDFHVSDATWQTGTVAQIATQADVIRVRDIDRDGRLDVVVRSSAGGVIQWLKGPVGATTAPLRAIPWQVFTLAEFKDRTPGALAVGDLTQDDQVEVIVAAEGGLAWFNPLGAATIFDQWTEQLIIDDSPIGLGSGDPPTTDPAVDPQDVTGTTLINTILIVDLDGDGANDIIATLDRAGLSGLTNDALVWFRNTKR